MRSGRSRPGRSPSRRLPCCCRRSRTWRGSRASSRRRTPAWSSFAPATRVSSPRRATLIAALCCIGGLIATASVVGLFANGVDPDIPLALAPDAAHRPILLGHHFLLGTQIVGVLLFIAAALGFIQRGERDNDELMRWFAAGAALSAFARFNYFLFPSLYSDWVFTGDFLRLGFCLLLLAGAAREIGSYWRRLASMAILEERRRIARELHDGVAQELSFIVTEAGRRHPGPDQLDRIGLSARKPHRSAWASLAILDGAGSLGGTHRGGTHEQGRACQGKSDETRRPRTAGGSRRP